MASSSSLLALWIFALHLGALAQSMKLPLHTEGRHVVDAEERRVKLACVNWYGAHLKTFVQNGLSENTIQGISRRISEMGFNCVRLSYSTEAYARNPPVHARYISKLANSSGRTFLDLFDETVSTLTEHRLMVIINNHNTYAGWCCNVFDGSSLWLNKDYPEEAWIASLTGLARRYRDNPWVVGYDLRNEVRTGYFDGAVEYGMVDVPVWGDTYSPFSGWPVLWRVKLWDWRDAVERAGVAILKESPHALIVVEILHAACIFCPVSLRKYPLRGLDGHVVWSPHDYVWLDKHVAWGWQMCETDFTNWEFLPSAVLNNVTHFLINQFLGMRGVLMAVVAACMLASSLSGKRSRAGRCMCAIPAVTLFVLLAVSICAWAVVPIRSIDSYEDYADSRDAVWGYISTQDIGPVWVAEFGEDTRTDAWTWTIRYLRERDLDFAYWSLDGERYPKAAEDLGDAVPGMSQEETYGLLGEE